MTDWFANASPAAAAAAGVDMVMPGDAGLLSFAGANMDITVNGVNETGLDRMVTHVIATWYKMGQDQNYPNISYSTLTKNTNGILPDRAYIGQVNYHVDVQSDHATLIRQIAGEGAVLVKNSGILPLTSSSSLKLGVFGSDAGPNLGGLNSCGELGTCNSGTLAVGWGSGSGTFPYLCMPPIRKR